jgi:CO/xanthine dehydrogenase FAD-binding subunit
LRFCRARSVGEAVEHLREWGDDACVLAGGTDVLVQFQRREISPGAFVHIEGIAELSSIADNGVTTIGAMTTHRRLATDAAIVAKHPALARAAATVGGWQIQTVGTVGGNICNASPAADTVAPLLVADAHVTLTARSGDRSMTLEDFVTDRRTTARRGDELLTSVTLQPLPTDGAETYLKVGRRSMMDVAVLGLAVRLRFADDVVTSARIATCAVAPTPRRATAAEAILVGSRLDVGAIAAAGQALIESSTPIDDARGTANYRRRVLPGLLARAIADCREQRR